MSTPTFATTHNLIAFLEKPLESDGFEQIVDFINANEIKHDLKLNDAEGTSCLSNAVIFKELAGMGAKTTSLNELSSTMASAIIWLANNQKFNFSKNILTSLVKNLEAGVPFYMFLRFIQRKHKPRRKQRMETKVSPTKTNTEEHVPTPSNDPLPSEMIEVMEIDKIITDEVSTACGELNATNEKPVSAAPTNITTTQPSEAPKRTVDITTAPKDKRIVFHDK
nr:hypothetical protein [Tanacetum cinerariifolium]